MQQIGFCIISPARWARLKTPLSIYLLYLFIEFVYRPSELKFALYLSDHYSHDYYFKTDTQEFWLFDVQATFLSIRGPKAAHNVKGIEFKT